MKVLITGCNGQVGSALVELYQEKDNVEILAVNHSELDITDQQTVMSYITQNQPDLIINAAAYTAVDKAEVDIEACYSINEKGPLYLAKAAQQVNALILHISTDYVFSGNKDGLYIELDETNPQGVYAKSKQAGELAITQFSTKYIILRTAWMFSQYGNNFVKTMLKAANNNSELAIVIDQIGGPTCAIDVAKALIAIGDELLTNNNPDLYGIYHFSGKPNVSWYDFADVIFTKAKQQGILHTIPKFKPIKTSEYKTTVSRPKNSRLDTNKISDTFAISPSDWVGALEDLDKYLED